MNPSPSHLLDAALGAAHEAAGFLRSQEGTRDPAQWNEKGRADFVTEVDREAERLIAASLGTAVPDSRVMGEELSPGASRSGLVWIVDPLDGTTNFLHGYPAWSVSVAAAIDGELQAGVVIHVPAGITYTATRGAGARQDGRPIAASRLTESRHALIGTGFPFKAPGRLPAYQRQFAAVLGAAAGIRRAGSAALDLCDVAAGRFDGFWELVLAPWDVAAGTLIAREAGALVTGLAGESDVLRHGPVVAGNAIIHRWLLETLASAGPSGS